MTHPATDTKDPPALEGGMLWTAGIVLALSNFVAVLNMTIANVTVPNIAGALGAGSLPSASGACSASVSASASARTPVSAISSSKVSLGGAPSIAGTSASRGCSCVVTGASSKAAGDKKSPVSEIVTAACCSCSRSDSNTGRMNLGEEPAQSLIDEERIEPDAHH